MSGLCRRWGSGSEQCLLITDHLGPCRTEHGSTLPDYSGIGKMRDDYNAGACLDCGEPAKWPSDFCSGCLDSRFSDAREYLDELRISDTHSSDVDPGGEE